ncbi:energy-coupling factor ABC transporter ATP-binding protein [Desulfonatronovibrio hydrogenovorans]|uniref:energy-coupling factor ABC transporter ATP-binding protein n=1 Tax=Desulfonatronovibrio hydrogenovorans TaxID=53245 RepID=UPI0004912C02|nr:ABC transporter ATP-binding protein [Desulfonatronovibrio hydrogenovorans]
MTGTFKALTISGLSFSYQEKIPALENIELEVHPGERLGIIGPNGAGKTTLFLMICGLLKPETGRIVLLNEPVESGRFNPSAAMVFQKSDDQLFCPSVWDDVAFGPENMGLEPEEIKERTTRALAAVGGLELAQRPVHHLSEGEKRMVSIAGVLAMHPRLIIYDEPSASLDIRSRRRLISILKESVQTSIIASHDLELILEVCTRVIIMDRGMIMADGDPVEIMGNEQLMLAHGQEKPHSLIPHQVNHKY